MSWKENTEHAKSGKYSLPVQAHQPRNSLRRAEPGSPLPSDQGPSHSARCVWLFWPSTDKKRGAALSTCNNLSLGRAKLVERLRHCWCVGHLLPRLICVSMAILVFWTLCAPALLALGLTPDSLAPVPWTLFGWHEPPQKELLCGSLDTFFHWSCLIFVSPCMTSVRFTGPAVKYLRSG